MSKKLILSLALSVSTYFYGADTVAPAIPRDEKIEQQIENFAEEDDA